MSMQLSTIHNLVRTYLRVLKLEPAEPAGPATPVAKRTDRVSLTHRARELARVARDVQVPVRSRAAGV